MVDLAALEHSLGEKKTAVKQTPPQQIAIAVGAASRPAVTTLSAVGASRSVGSPQKAVGSAGASSGQTMAVLSSRIKEYMAEIERRNGIKDTRGQCDDCMWSAGSVDSDGWGMRKASHS